MKEYVKRILPIIGLTALYFLILLLKHYKIINPYHIQILKFVCINIIMTVSLNVINGITGQFCIGQAGFMSLGAYGSAIVSTLLFHGNSAPGTLRIPIYLLSLLAGSLFAMFIGYLISLPTFRIKGDYLAIVTLAFGEIVRAVLRLIEPIGAARGMIGIPNYSSLAWAFFFVALTLYVVRNFTYSQKGRACIAIRDDEIAAEAMGINTTHYKIIGFCLAAFIAGLAGGIYAHTVSFIQPDTFSFIKSNDYLVFLYAGGVGTLTGSILGATLLTILPEALRFLANWRIVTYAILLVMIMIYRPSGLCGGIEFSFLKVDRNKYAKALVAEQKGGSENE